VRLVLDTNILVAALNFDGLCRMLVKRTVRHDDIFTSEALLEELRDKLAGKFGWEKEKAQETVALYRGRFTLLDPKPLARQVCRDRDDDHVIAVAMQAGAEAVITGDKDLLALVSYQGLRFVSPREFWDYSAAD
jgi:putative PIN family toxin of toxin-antitoxin system